MDTHLIEPERVAIEYPAADAVAQIGVMIDAYSAEAADLDERIVKMEEVERAVYYGRLSNLATRCDDLRLAILRLEARSLAGALAQVKAIHQQLDELCVHELTEEQVAEYAERMRGGAVSIIKVLESITKAPVAGAARTAQRRVA